MKSLRICSFLILSLVHSLAFIAPCCNNRSDQRHITPSELALVPVANFRNQISFLDTADSYRCGVDKNGVFQANGESYILCIAEETDMPDTAQFITEVFGADVISLSQDLNSLERALLQPGVGLLNAYSGLVAFAEVFAGIQSRTKDRRGDLAPTNLSGSRDDKLRKAERSSLILLVAKRRSDSDWHIDVIASVELRLQPTDAKIPFSLPFLDRAERRLASWLKTSDDQARDLQPYLSNLCVDETYRRNQLGKALVRCVEDIARTAWGYDRLYLHVDKENEAALRLYGKEGYQDAGRRWRPFWAGGAVEIAYFVKKLT